MRRLTRTFLGTATAAAVVVAVGGSALAGPPIVQDHYEFTDSHIEQEEHEGFCPEVPFLVRFDVEAEGFFSGVHHGDGFAYFGDRYRITETYTNVETGRRISILSAGAFKDQTITDNGDGTITITSQDAGRTRVFDNDGNLLFRDMGLVRFEILVDTAGTPGDPDDDVFIEFLGDTKEAGLFETADRDFCADILEFLG